MNNTPSAPSPSLPLPRLILRLGGLGNRKFGKDNGLDEDPASLAEGSELFRALRKLPPDQAAAVVLRHHHGYTNREIAFALGAPESTIASRLAKAKERLREELKWPKSREASRQAPRLLVSEGDARVVLTDGPAE